MELPDYPERSVTEGIVNALIHRDYLVVGSEVHIDIFDDRLEIYSPGGMFDGINVQDRDIMTVPSQRRNPIIADVFSRLIYMERRGSGFKKIIEDYQFQHNYTEELAPTFKSEYGSFFLTLKNLNFNSEINTRDDFRDDFQDKNETKTKDDEMQSRAMLVLELIRKNPNATIKGMAKDLDISRQKVERAITRLQEQNIISREGSSRRGRWIIN